MIKDNELFEYIIRSNVLDKEKTIRSKNLEEVMSELKVDLETIIKFIRQNIERLMEEI